MGNLEMLAAKLDRLVADPQARLSYDQFAGGLVWSDELPQWGPPVYVDGAPNIAGLGEFRALLNHRQALILEEPATRFADLWSQARQMCPNWPGFLPARQDPALALEARARKEAALLSCGRGLASAAQRQPA
jgi:hypothetical protein